MVLRANVQAPPARPPAYGLIAAAPPLDSTDRWEQGWAFEPEGCATGLQGKLPITCQGSTDAVAGSSADAVEGDPIWIWGADRCTTLQRSRDNEGRARRQLAAIESYELADELWNGTVSDPDGLANRWLAGPAVDSDTLTSGGVTPVAALGCVTQGLAELLRGAPGMVHTTPQLLQHLVADSIVTRQGNLWMTAMGHVVVADAGYSGAGPDATPAGSTQWIYGTPMLRIRRGPVELTDTIDRTVNTRLVVAGRLAGIQWDNECAHVAAEVAIPICAVGGGA